MKALIALPFLAFAVGCFALAIHHAKLRRESQLKDQTIRNVVRLLRSVYEQLAQAGEDPKP
jgi:hypothetical protein